jgi:hypothetical protein
MRLFDHLKPEWRHRLFIAYAVAMLLVFLIPTPDTGIEVRNVDKAVHFLLFFGFALMFYLDRHRGPGRVIIISVSYTNKRAHEAMKDLVMRSVGEKK